MIQIIIFSAIAGILGTGLGGIIAALLLKNPQAEERDSKHTNNIICFMLSFSAGVMISIVCFGLAYEANELTGTNVTVIGLVTGIVIVMLLNRIVDKIYKSKDNLHFTPEELYHESQIISNQKKMFRSGVLMFLAIALHNFPEGMAIGAGGSYDFHFGMLLAIMIALHNIPEGMAIAAPLLAGGVKKWRVIVLTALSGTPTLLGGLLGTVIGKISDFSIAVCLSAAGGAMLYVVFGEIIPQAVVMTKNRIATIIMLFGIIMGFIVTQANY